MKPSGYGYVFSNILELPNRLLTRNCTNKRFIDATAGASYILWMHWKKKHSVVPLITFVTNKKLPIIPTVIIGNKKIIKKNYVLDVVSVTVTNIKSFSVKFYIFIRLCSREIVYGLCINSFTWFHVIFETQNIIFEFLIKAMKPYVQQKAK